MGQENYGGRNEGKTSSVLEKRVPRAGKDNCFLYNHYFNSLEKAGMPLLINNHKRSVEQAKKQVKPVLITVPKPENKFLLTSNVAPIIP